MKDTLRDLGYTIRDPDKAKRYEQQQAELADGKRRLLLAGAESLQDASYYTLVIEASFVAIERTVEFRLLERGTMQPEHEATADVLRATGKGK